LLSGRHYLPILVLISSSQFFFLTPFFYQCCQFVPSGTEKTLVVICHELYLTPVFCTLPFCSAFKSRPLISSCLCCSSSGFKRLFLNFSIQDAGSDQYHLPTSSPCIDLLKVSNYKYLHFSHLPNISSFQYISMTKHYIPSCCR